MMDFSSGCIRKSSYEALKEARQRLERTQLSQCQQERRERAIYQEVRKEELRMAPGFLG